MTDQLRYNEVRQKSIHNTFQRHEGIADQFLYWRIRSMEVDVHDTDIFGESIKADWALYHDWHDPMSTVARLSQFLEICQGLHAAVPNHEVVTLFIDIKDPLAVRAASDHSWKVLDKLFDDALGPALYRPRDLAARVEPSLGLRRAVEAAGWPTLAELRGKFIVVLTGSRTQLGNYANSDQAAVTRSAFLSTPVDGLADIPGGDDTVFFNINGEKRMHLVSAVNPLGYIARVYYVNTRELWYQATAGQAHHIATDKVNERMDRWASVRSSDGYPFELVTGGRIAGTEAGTVCGMWATSDDMWDKSDSLAFCYNRHTTATSDNTYEFAISSPNSHTDDWVKGAVMARAGLEPDDAYFAVVRMGEKHGLRVQFRPDKGDPTTTTNPRIGPSGMFGDDVDQDTIVHVRLQIDRGGTRARAWGSYDRANWTALGYFEFGMPLRFQGLGVSSHGQRRGAKFLFVAPEESTKPLFRHEVFIGDTDSGHGGWVDWKGRGRWLTTALSGYTPVI